MIIQYVYILLTQAPIQAKRAIQGSNKLPPPVSVSLFTIYMSLLFLRVQWTYREIARMEITERGH